MVTPAFVGAGDAAYDPVVAWPTSIAMSASTPANVRDGDRVVCFVTSFAEASLTVTLPTPTNWTLVETRQLNQLSQHLGLWVFSARWGSDTKDQLVSPTAAPATGYTWRLQCAAWRPSKPVGSNALTHQITSAVNSFPLESGPISSLYAAYGTTVVTGQITRNGSYT